MKRRIAREMAIQSLYQLEMTEVTPEEAVAMIVAESSNLDNEIGVKPEHAEAMHKHVLEWVRATWKQRGEIDLILAHYLKNWQMDRLSRVDRQILRLACYEMKFRDDVPPKVAINEAINLAKHFGTDESGKFVNGVLGQLMRDTERPQVSAAADTEEADLEE
ncbi:transcription antitermination factor NusB [Paenibacillus apiarius]|uniref:Transcription antitermination protein NusB n=1 Tax=Paenibacillus apiarius TaxID=46240 RepID=A0ABT4DN82_9BACL|nr:transcription antitermination factor NusB [Paenibacillus apiarius]MCY9517314.1 transcription antitermination factor NusB [Paenibacillus apiarius]MCY9518815.1 transcription antitermination factor NusB [Paenibacillus apiarius]MCY9552744.1 transcription antitermination factor NusB [Paenibacillus apiarius]MCY9556769.1 transcription antitermination factor NusB [Paenibacillus apiarius]MCY9684332.1 transcription antitermination factor NusB [Paenibacillus apiarius]